MKCLLFIFIVGITASSLFGVHLVHKKNTTCAQHEYVKGSYAKHIPCTDAQDIRCFEAQSETQSPESYRCINSWSDLGGLGYTFVYYDAEDTLCASNPVHQERYWQQPCYRGTMATCNSTHLHLNVYPQFNCTGDMRHSLDREINVCTMEMGVPAIISCN
jgi:hypothetical protein